MFPPADDAPYAPSMETYVRAIVQLGLFEEVVRWPSAPLRVRVHHEILARIFNITILEVYELLHYSELRREQRRSPLARRRTSVWVSTRNVQFALFDFVGYGMVSQQRYRGVRRCIRMPHQITFANLIWRTSRCRRRFEEIFALFEARGPCTLVMVLRHEFAVIFPEIALALRALT